MNIKQEIARFVREEEGAGVIEYSLIAAIMAAIIIAALQTGVGEAISTAFSNIATQITNAGNQIAG